MDTNTTPPPDMVDTAAIQARANAARQGRWQDIITDEGALIIICDNDQRWPVAFVGDMEETDKYDHANARFIAAAHTDIPILCHALTVTLAELHNEQREAKYLEAALLRYYEDDECVCAVDSEEGELWICRHCEAATAIGYEVAFEDRSEAAQAWLLKAHPSEAS
jgi:hypothetical protein